MALFRKAQYSTIRSTGKKDIPEIYEKCKSCKEGVYKKALYDNFGVCPKCGFNNPITYERRIELLTDKDSFKQIDSEISSIDALKFDGAAPYTDKLKSNIQKTGIKEAIITGTATLDSNQMALGIMDFRFLGASMGSVVGEKFTRLAELAKEKRIPLVVVTASGGARMYEGMLSLMQMAKTSGALSRLNQAGIPYIVIMTDPTTAGVTASFASLGDIIIAEPKALIGFAGPRVIRDTTQAALPEGFQSSEFLMKKGFIDRIVDRKDLRKELSLLLQYFKKSTQ